MRFTVFCIIFLSPSVIAFPKKEECYISPSGSNKSNTFTYFMSSRVMKVLLIHVKYRKMYYSKANAVSPLPPFIRCKTKSVTFHRLKRKNVALFLFSTRWCCIPKQGIQISGFPVSVFSSVCFLKKLPYAMASSSSSSSLLSRIFAKIPTPA